MAAKTLHHAEISFAARVLFSRKQYLSAMSKDDIKSRKKMYEEKKKWLICQMTAGENQATPNMVKKNMSLHNMKTILSL